jgi:hypothetical protein
MQGQWFVMSGGFMLLGGCIAGGTFLQRANHVRKRMNSSDPYRSAWQTFHQESVQLPEQKVLRYLGLHLSTLFSLKETAVRRAIGIFFLISMGLGLFTGIKVYAAYIGWSGDLPYNSFTIWLPFISGLFAGFIPFLFMHAFIQIGRVKKSYQLLDYAEELERQYLALEAIKPALEAVTEHTKGVLQDLTFRLIHALQRGHLQQILDVLALFEHQIGTKFAHVFTVLIREGAAVDSRYGKDIRVGLRSLIEKMHLQQQVQSKDKPKKREMSQIGLLTFPVLYGAHHFASAILADKARHYLFEVPSQLNIFVGAILIAVISFTLNTIFGKRRLDM